MQPPSLRRVVRASAFNPVTAGPLLHFGLLVVHFWPMIQLWQPLKAAP